MLEHPRTPTERKNLQSTFARLVSEPKAPALDAAAKVQQLF